jgi:hypothetical protein
MHESAPSPDVLAHSSKALYSFSHAEVGAADGAGRAETGDGVGSGAGAVTLHEKAVHCPSLKQLSKAVFSASQLPHSGQVSMAVHE